MYLLGVLGGVAGCAAALYQEMRSGSWLLVVLVAPAIEEVCKPIGVIFMLEKRPNWLRSAGQVFALTLLGALVFATCENVLYVCRHYSSLGATFLAWRFGVCTGVHLITSAIFGLGLVKMWKHIRRHGGHFDIDVCFGFYVAAVAVHAGYNSVVVILRLAGVLEF